MSGVKVRLLKSWRLGLAVALATVGALAPTQRADAQRTAAEQGQAELAAESAAAQPAAEQDAPAPVTLTSVIDAALADPILEDATVGISVVDTATGESLYARGADTPLNPASNVKLVTTASALRQLGPEHRYSTLLFHAKDALQGDVIKGNVWLQGHGDPDLVTGDLYELAMRLRGSGVKRITGGVIVDASAFDRDELPPGFDQKEELASYRAPSGASSVNFNTFVVRVRAGASVGADAIARVEPPVPSIDLDVVATTQPGHRRGLWADVQPTKSGMKVKLSGSIGIDARPATYRYPVADPSAYAGDVMTLALKHAGIKVGKSKKKVGGVPRGAEIVGSHASAPLSVLIRAVNKYSNNFMAEQILKTLDLPAKPATFDGALTRVRDEVAALGIEAEGMSLGNGSGLYDTNRVTPAQMTSLLTAMLSDFRYRADYLASLAVMGVDGTTRSRLRETDSARWIRVKTGTLNGISALSGYVGSKDRAPIAFSILLNDLPGGGTSKARGIQNVIADVIARHASGRPLVDPDADAP